MLSEYDNEKDLLINSKMKRDEFLVEIRRQKTNDIITKRRREYFFGEQENSKDIIEECSTNTLIPFDTNNGDGSFIIDYEQGLYILQEKFYDFLKNQKWNDIISVLIFLRENVGIEENKIPPKMVIATGMVPDILELLDPKYSEHRKLQNEAAWVIANISAGGPDDTSFLVDKGAIYTLFECLKSSNQELHENAIWSLANLAGEKDLKYRDQIIELDMVGHLVNQACKGPKKTNYTRTVSWLLSNLLRGKPHPPYEKVCSVLVILSQLIHHQDNDIQEYTLMSLYNLASNGDKTALNAIYRYGLIPKIVKYINNPNELISTYALKCTGVLSSGNSEIVKQLAQSEFLQIIPHVLNHRNKTMRRDGCFALSNILCEETSGIPNISQTNILDLIIERIGSDTIITRTDATYCLANFCKACTVEDVQIVVGKGALEAIMMNISSNDIKLVCSSLNALRHILLKGEGLKKCYNGLNPYVQNLIETNCAHALEELQLHEDCDVYKGAGQILEEFFPVTESSQPNF